MFSCALMLSALAKTYPADKVLARISLPGPEHRVAAVIESSNREFPELKTILVITKLNGKTTGTLLLLDGVPGADVKVLRPTGRILPQFWISNSGVDHFAESVVAILRPNYQPAELYKYSGRAEVSIRVLQTIKVREVYSFGLAGREIPGRFTNRGLAVVRDFAYDATKQRYLLEHDFHYDLPKRHAQRGRKRNVPR